MCQGCGKIGTFIIAEEIENGAAILENVWQFFQKLKLELPYNSTILLICIYPRELKVYIHTKNTYVNVQSSFIHNNSKVETTKMSFY